MISSLTEYLQLMGKIVGLERQKGTKNGRLLTSHRSTAYPCCIPALGDLTGAGRVRPAKAKVR